MGKKIAAALMIAMLLLSGCAPRAQTGDGAANTGAANTGSVNTGAVDTTPPADAGADTGNDAVQTDTPQADEFTPIEGYVDAVPLDTAAMAQEAIMIAEAVSAVSLVLEPSADGLLTAENDMAVIDYSNTADGYVMVKFTAQTQKRLKAQVKGPHTTYTYNLRQGEWAVLPLTDGNGGYVIKVFENISGSQYSLVLAAQQDVTLKDEFAPFLRPNQYVDFSASSLAVAKAIELTQGLTDPLEKVEVIYNYVVTNLTYDKEKAATVTSGYLPVLDEILAQGKGICFDYAALMTGMLRSIGIPCKMVFGYAGSAYHAWISVWTEDEGWVQGVIFFDGTAWQRLDPTFASSAGRSDDIMEFIGDGSNYREKYFY